MKLSHYNRILFATILASGAMGLIGRMISLAYPIFESYFQAEMTELQWVMATPILAASSIILIGGRLGDYFGKRKMYNLGMLVFIFGLLVSALGFNIKSLIFGQALVGLGMALAAPACLSLIVQEISKEEQGGAIGTWAGLSGAFGVLGLIVGGVIIDTLGWQYIFYLTMPIAIAAIIVLPKEQNSSRGEAKTRINYPVMLAMFLAILFLVFSLIRANQNKWESCTAIVQIVIALFALVLIVIFQNRLKSPLVPLSIFDNREMLAANLGTFFIYFSLNGVYIFLVFHLQSYYDYSPTSSGWAMIPASLLVTILASKFGKMSTNGFDIKLLRWGTLIVTLGIMGLFIPGESASYFKNFFPMIILLGIGMSMFVSPITSFSLRTRAADTGLASGINNLLARFSGILAVAILGGVFAVIPEELMRFRVSVIIMSVSSLIGTFLIWVLIPEANKGDLSG